MDKGTATELVKAEMNKFNVTRDIQWKMNIAAWGLVIAAIYFFDKKGAVNIDSGRFAWMVILSLVFLGSHIIFIRLTQRSLGVSKAVWNTLIKQLNDCALDIVVDIENESQKFKFSPRDRQWIFFQILATSSLVIAFLLLNAKCPA